MKNLFCILVLALVLAADAPAQTLSTTDITDLTLQDLLDIQIVSAASKFPQEVREAPASITIVSSADIRRHGYRTLTDILGSVRGLYMTYDRNYAYIGIRGFSRPGDYNTRVLLLVDGHRLNDPIYDMAPLGTDFPIDVSLIERVEVIRGPGSALYGTSAFFAVINVVTKSGTQQRGIVAEGNIGSLDTRGGTISTGHRFANGNDLLVSGSWRHSQGAARLHFPELESEGDGTGIAAGLDGDRSAGLFTSMTAGRVTVRGAIGYRDKQVPTASFDAIFGDPREATFDTRAYVDAVYEGPVGGDWNGTFRLGYDHYGYRGVYPYDYGEPDVVLWRDGAASHTLSGEATLRRRIGQAHLITGGAEIRRHIKNSQWGGDDWYSFLVRQPGTTAAVYVQDEVRVAPWLIVSGGLRLDHDESFGSHVTPRAGAVFLPRTQTAVKLLYGQAFRAPNAYELHYYSTMAANGFLLEPESVRSTELVWEELLSPHLRTAVTIFHYDADRIIEQRTLGDGDLYFANASGVHATGIETELEARLGNGVGARLSHAYTSAVDRLTDARLSNSPRHIAKAGLQIPIDAFVLSLDGQAIGRRMTLAGTSIAPVVTTNVTLSSPLNRRVQVTLGLYNALDARYGDPGGVEHRQTTIPQDGRTAKAKLRVSF